MLDFVTEVEWYFYKVFESIKLKIIFLDCIIVLNYYCVENCLIVILSYYVVEEYIYFLFLV